jgi:hypothetical protein
MASAAAASRSSAAVIRFHSTSVMTSPFTWRACASGERDTG